MRKQGAINFDPRNIANKIKLVLIREPRSKDKLAYIKLCTALQKYLRYTNNFMPQSAPCAQQHLAYCPCNMRAMRTQEGFIPASRPDADFRFVNGRCRHW